MKVLLQLFTICYFALSLLLIQDLKAQSPTDLNVMTYNLLNFPNTDNYDPLGNDNARATAFRQIVDGNDIDVILIQEMTQAIGASILVNELNTNGTTGKTFASTLYVGYGFTNAMLGNMLIYNTDKLDFIQKTEITPTATGTAQDGSTQTAPRGVSKYTFDVKSSDCATALVPIVFYNMHLKGGNGGASNTSISDEDVRYLNIVDMYANLASVSSTENVVIGGDFNLYNTSESVYTEVTNASNTHHFTDPIGFWTRNNTTYINKYTQSTRTVSSFYGNGGVPGGMDDRFDFLLFNQTINNSNNQISYQIGSAQTIGNLGVGLNNNALNGSNTYTNQVHQISDHYPVKFQLNVEFDPVANCNPNNCPNVTSIINLPNTITSGAVVEFEGLPTGGVVTSSAPTATIVKGIFNNNLFYFNPNFSGNGIFNVTYTYDDGKGCITATTQAVEVNKTTFNITDQCGN